MSEERGPWYLVTGLLVGLVMGLAYTWVVSPLRYVDTTPDSMRQEAKDQYRALIAAAYAANGDLERARARLNELKDSDPYRVLAAQAQQKLAQGGISDEARALGALAAALSQSPDPPVPLLPTASLLVADPTSAPPPITLTPSPVALTEIASSTTLTPTAGTTATDVGSPTGSPTPTPTRTPLPTLTPTATPGAPFVLAERSLVCNPEVMGPLIQVQVNDAAGQGVPGVVVIVIGPDQEERFFTGLKPELGPGYADFTMTPGVNYVLRLADSDQAVTDLTAAECARLTGERYWGAWSLIFTQPES